MSNKQITARLPKRLYQAFDQYCTANQGLPESACLCQLLESYFYEGGHRREPKHRLTEIKRQLDELLAN
jgi:hypothetical protein